MAKKSTDSTKKQNPASGFVSAGGKHVNGFLDFIRTQGVVGLAVGLLLGTAAGVLANSLIDNIVMPPVGMLLGSQDGLAGLTWNIGTVDGEAVLINYGTFLNDILTFFVIALVVYLVFKSLGLDKLDKKKS